jgi:hypothetical protein
VGFPLAPLPVADGYKRLHPSWPSEEQTADLRSRLAESIPGGLERDVTGAIRSCDEGVLAGWTVMDSIAEQSRIVNVRYAAIRAGGRHASFRRLSAGLAFRT